MYDMNESKDNSSIVVAIGFLLIMIGAFGGVGANVLMMVGSLLIVAGIIMYGLARRQ